MDNLFDFLPFTAEIESESTESTGDTNTDLLFQILEKVTVLQYQIEQLQKKESAESEDDVTNPAIESTLLDEFTFFNMP